MSRLSIRWRLTLWYGAVLVAVLAVFGSSVFLLMSRELRNRTSRALSIQMTVIEEQVGRIKSQRIVQERLQRLYSHHPAFDIQVTGSDETLWMRSDRILSRRLPGPPYLPETDDTLFQNFKTSDNGHYRMASRTIVASGSPLLVQVATSLDDNDKQLGELLAILLLAGPVALGCTVGGGYLLARKALAPVDRMAAAAEEITATRLDRRLHTPNPDDELGRLARTLNGMIARLERSFEEVRRFTADAAHELRTPLAILRNEAEVALRVPRDSEAYRTSLEDMLEEIEHLSQLSEALLFLFREDAGLGAQHRDLIALDQVVREIADHMRVVAAQQHQELILEAVPPCFVMGDAEQLRRLFFNLLDNAIKFTPPDGMITISMTCHKHHVCAIVADNGIGIAPEHLPRIFDRFYRADSARSQRTAGNGLGLSICRSIVETHHGSIEVDSRPDEGTRVSLTLPITMSSFSETANPEILAAQRV
jgi:heavy metal sensor kinase